MVIKVGVNGFGRIGRIIFRTCFPKSNIEISAINDPAVDIEYICYLMKFDSTHGKFVGDITYSEDEITVNDKKIKIFREKFPSDIPWHVIGVQYVIEASGMFATVEKASGHLHSSCVKRVLVTAPSVDIPMIILGVNEDQITSEHRIISCASSTLYCLAPIIKVLVNNFGVSEGFVTSIHAMTPSLKPLDGLCLRGRHWRDHRSIHQNIIPAATGACKALGKIIPQVKEKFCGLAFRVPIVNVSVLDITLRLNKSTSLQEIAAQIESARQMNMKNIINTSYDEIVSSDFINDKNSCTLDVNSSLTLTSKSFKLVCWYENEYSYACRVIDTIMFSEAQLKCNKCWNTLCAETDSDSNNCTSISTPYNENILKKIHFENNLRIFNNMSIGSQFIEQLNKTRTSGQLQRVHFDEHLNYFKTNKSLLKKKDDVVTRLLDENGNSTIYITNKVCESIESNNITEKQQQTIPISKELARLANEAENLVKHNLNTMLFEESKANQEINNIRNLPNSIDKKALNISHAMLSSETKNINQIKIGDESENSEINDELLKIYKPSSLDVSDCCTKFVDKGVNQVQERIVFDMESNGNRNIIINNIKSTIAIDTKDGKNVKGGREQKLCNKNNCSIQSQNNNITMNVTVDSNCQSVSNQNVSEVQNILEKIEDYKRKENMNKVIRKRIMSTILKNNSKDKLSMFGGPLKLINRDEQHKTKKDLLFDKLDSNSGSEASFKIFETKSQVIDITDLASSTDNFERLDKICRIIEISDELSDQLFSALDISGRASNSVWSFKDLCEKIKLDDFCQNLFGE